MSDPDRRAFGARLRALRKAAGKTMRDVADDLGVSTVYVSDVERGNRAPFHPEVVCQVADLLRAERKPLLTLAASSRVGFEAQRSASWPPSLERAASRFRDALERNIAREEQCSTVPRDMVARAITISNWAKRLIEAKDMRDDGLTARAESNLRKALEWWR